MALGESRFSKPQPILPVISRTSPSKLGKSLGFHEIVMFLMSSDRFTPKPKNRDFFFPKVGGGKKSGVQTVTMSGKAGSVGALSPQPGVSVRREQAVFNVLFSRGERSAAPLIFSEDPSSSVSRSPQHPAMAKAPQFRRAWRRLPARARGASSRASAPGCLLAGACGGRGQGATRGSRRSQP